MGVEVIAIVEDGVDRGACACNVDITDDDKTSIAKTLIRQEIESIMIKIIEYS